MTQSKEEVAMEEKIEGGLVSGKRPIPPLAGSNDRNLKPHILGLAHK